MTTRPILFSGPMVRAILDGRKTQTRRVVKHITEGPGGWPSFSSGRHFGNMLKPKYCPYGQPGDRLWVKEAVRRIGARGEKVLSEYVADGMPTWGDRWPWKLKTLPSMFCPYALSRIALEITGVRVERVQEISRQDAVAEGSCIDNPSDRPAGYLDSNWPEQNFRALWDSINRDRGYGWDVNPWVWVIAFEAAEKKGSEK